MYEYWYIILFFVVLFVFAYIKIKYPFWNAQPVYHSYDFWRYFSQTSFIIQRKLPIKTKFYDHKHVETIDFSDLKDFHMTRLIDLLQCHYLKSDKMLFIVKEDFIRHSFIGHSQPCYVSFFNEIAYNETQEHYNSFSSKNLITEKGKDSDDREVPTVEPLGFICSRPLILYITSETQFHTVYFWDLMCVNRNDISKNIDRQLMQTHEYNQRFRNMDVSVSIFKKESPLHEGVVPLVEFTTSIFLLRSKSRVPRLPAHHLLIHMDSKNVSEIYDFLTEMRGNFTLSIYPEIGSILALSKSRQLQIYALKCKGDILGLYFFKNSNMLYEEGGQTLEYVSTLWNPLAYQNFQDSIKTSLFFVGFLLALKSTIEQGKNDKIQYKFIKFNRLGDTCKIIDQWKQKYAPIYEKTAAYYLYNMVIPGMPFLNNNCFILN